MNKSITISIVASLLLFPGMSMANESTKMIVAGQKTWKENYTAMAVGSDRGEGCENAKGAAWGAVGYSAACIARMGAKVDEEFKRCSCVKVTDGVFNCTIDIVVTCESNR